MKSTEIGGFLELELNKEGTLYHDNAIAVNTGRNALEYILIVNQYSHLYIPYFTCDAVLEPIQKLGIGYSFYEIDKDFKPIFDFSKLKIDEGFIYTNYFGLCDNLVNQLILKCKNLIVDNAQAFFHRINTETSTFYSPRKFFGVSDGGFLYSTQKMDKKLEKDSSLKRLSHLMGRLEKRADQFYQDYQAAEASLQNEPIKLMSNTTERILNSIDYNKVKQKRQENYELLHKELKADNQLDLPALENEVPLCYPFLVPNGFDVKKRLIENKIYVPTYWPNVLEWSKPKSIAYNLTKNLVCLPIDQRYGEIEMQIIIEKIQSFNE